MNYHRKALQVIQQAQSDRELFKLLLEVGIKRPSEIIEAWDRLHPKAKPEKPPALIKGAEWPKHVGFRKLYRCTECKVPVKAVGITGACVKCAPGSFSIGVNQEVVA